MQYAFDPGGECRFFLDSSLVDELANALSSGGMLKDDIAKGTLDLEKTGLTKDTLRELIVASYVTQATTDTVVGIEIPDSDMNLILKGALELQLVGDGSLIQNALNVATSIYSDIGLSDFSQDNGGDTGSRWAYFRFGRYYYYIIESVDSNGNFKHQYYLAEKGTIQIQNENGESIKCYSKDTFDKYLEWFNGNANQVKATNTYLSDTFYTVPEIGKIEVVSIDNNNGSYSFTKKELDYASDTEISNCIVPTELLVDFLNISASPDFLNKFEALVKEQEVIIKLYSLTTSQTVQTHTEQDANPSADITATIAYEPDENFQGPLPNGGQYVYEQISQTETFDPITITQDTTATHTSTNYELVVEKANTWFVKMERTSHKTSNTNITTQDSTVAGYTIQGSGDSAFYDSRIDSKNQSTLAKNLEFNNLWTRIEGNISSIPNFKVLQKESSISTDATTVEVQDGTKTVTTTTTIETINKGTLQYDDNTDAFLGLWKNKDGKYHQYAKYNSSTGQISGYNNEALFDPDGKKVGYKDLYGDNNAYIGDLFVNADEELFELLEASASSDRTESYVNIMKYILYRYTDDDYGITNFDQLISLLGLNRFRSVSTVSGRSALSEFLKSWENTPLYNYLNGNADYNSSPYIYKCITQDKQNYIMCDDLFTGNNNKNFGFGVCFWVNYAQSWNNVGYFNEEGIDIRDAKYQTYGVSILSVEIVDRVKAKIIEDQRQNARDMAKARNITLEDYQIDAIAACMYQGWQMGDFLDAYKQYGLTDSIRAYSSGMNSNCMPPARGDANWELFSRGIYRDPAGNEIVVQNPTGGGSILESAEKIHTYMEQNNYFYCLDGRLRDTFEESKSTKGTCCATFVSWVLRDAGLIDQTRHYVGSEGSDGLNNILENTYHWTRVSASQLQPGDVMVYTGRHIEIYAGNGTIYNAGSDSAVKNAAPSYQYATPDYGLRAP